MDNFSIFTRINRSPDWASPGPPQKVEVHGHHSTKCTWTPGPVPTKKSIANAGDKDNHHKSLYQWCQRLGITGVVGVRFS